MGWARDPIRRLCAGEGVQFRPRGHSMRGLIDDGQLVSVTPPRDGEPSAGDVVLCRVRGNDYLHLVKAVQGDRYLIGNNLGGVNGWISRKAIYGVWRR